VARCTTERLMRELGLQGVRRGRKIRTTVPGTDGHRAGDLLRRDFTAAPSRRWVADFTYVATWVAMVYVAFVVDMYSRAIVGWELPPASGPSSSWMPCRWRCGGVTTTGADLVPFRRRIAVHRLRVHRPSDRGRDRPFHRHRRRR
jgi:hypothetical protein